MESALICVCFVGEMNGVGGIGIDLATAFTRFRLTLGRMGVPRVV